MAQKHMQTGNRNAPVSTNMLRNESAWGRGNMINNSTEKERSPGEVPGELYLSESPPPRGWVGCPAGVQGTFTPSRPRLPQIVSSL